MPGAGDIECVSFEESLLACSVPDEICALRRDSLKVILGHVKEVIKGRIDPFGLQEWRSFKGIPLIKVEHGGELLIYACERHHSDEAETKISIMFAGNRQKGYQSNDFTWDGSDESLWTVVEARCRYHFH